jgi:hypothetical protein
MVGAETGGQKVELNMQIQRFHLPPVESALLVGRRAGIGPKAMNKALAEMLPGVFQLISVEHPVIEAIIVRTTHLRTVPEERLVQLLVARCEPFMDETDMIHVRMELIIHANEKFEI